MSALYTARCFLDAAKLGKLTPVRFEVNRQGAMIIEREMFETGPAWAHISEGPDKLFGLPLQRLTDRGEPLTLRLVCAEMVLQARALE